MAEPKISPLAKAAMTVRNARKCRRNCPEPPVVTEVKASPSPRVLNITSESEGERLWHHVLFGTGTCVDMIEGYHAANMPGNPLERIKSLSGRLQAVINTIETNNEGSSSSE